MPLAVLLPVVILGIAGIGLLLHLTGQSRSLTLTDTATARQHWDRHWPGASIAALDLAGGAALVLDQDGPGLLRPFGADTVAPRLADLTETPEGLRAEFHDFAAPPVTLRLDPDARTRWLTLWRTHHARLS